MSKLIEQAFRELPREQFLPPDMVTQADLDAPLPIGFGSTNSQPTTVRLMLEWLNVQQGQKILDVGSGSGWTTALLAFLTGSKGKVIAVEKVPKLVSFGRDNCIKFNLKNTIFKQADTKSLGDPKDAPFDRILVSASPKTLPGALVNQLADGGIMVIPVNSDIWVVKKQSKNSLDIQKHPGFAFVPLLTDD